jgi:hypothetical protein
MSLESESKPKGPEWDRAALDGYWHALTDADTANSLIERHDTVTIDIGFRLLLSLCFRRTSCHACAKTEFTLVCCSDTV